MLVYDTITDLVYNACAAYVVANARAEGVQVHVLTADMCALPIATGSVNLVVSSLAIHNIPSLGGRTDAVTEAAWFASTLVQATKP